MQYPPLPDEIEDQIRSARRLELWTIFFLFSIVIVMYLTLGSSQAMKTAWLEDLLSLLPPSLFVFSSWLERRPPTGKFPYGFHRAGSLAFFASACALVIMGGFLIYESAHALLIAEHPTVGSVSLFGREVWLGWLMMAALAYSVVPPVILGRMKLKIAERLRDQVLHTDACMNKADWQTGLAGILGIAGIAAGFWWADAAAAGLISFSILHDGVGNLRTALAELMDGAPREIGGDKISAATNEIVDKLSAEHPGAFIRIRQTGRYLRVHISPARSHSADGGATEALMGDDSWRLIEIGKSTEL